MELDRRDILKTITGASVMLAGLSGSARSATTESPFAPLIAVGLDPLTTYRRMFATAENNAGCCWLYTGIFPADHDDVVGAISFWQEETLCTTRTEDIDKNSFKLHQLTAGTFRDLRTGNIVKSTYDPRTGQTEPSQGTFLFKPSHFTISRDGDSLAFDVKYPTAPVLGVTATTEVKGDRVCITTFTEYNSSATNKTGHISILRFYSSLAELKTNAPSVVAQGFYCDRLRDSFKIEVSGNLQKGGIGDKTNVVAWDHLRGVYPEFFDGDHVSLKF